MSAHFSDPNLTPWSKILEGQENWRFFGSNGSRKDVITKLCSFFNGGRTETRLILIGPWKIGKTSTINYAMQGRQPIWISVEKETWQRSLPDKIAQAFIEVTKIISTVNDDDDWHNFIEITKKLYKLSKTEETEQGMLERLKPRYHCDAQNLRELWKALALRLHIEDATASFENAYEIASQSPQGAIGHFVVCMNSLLLRCQRRGGSTMLVFEEHGVGGPPEDFVRDIFNSAQHIARGAGISVKFILETRESYQGPEERQERQVPRGTAYRGNANRGDIRQAALQKITYLEAFTPAEAKELIQENWKTLNGSPLPYEPESILKLIGYHPALLQLVCWKLLVNPCTHPQTAAGSTGICQQCLKECTDEIYQLVKDNSLLTTDEIRAIANDNTDAVKDSLREKGLIL